MSILCQRGWSVHLPFHSLFVPGGVAIPCDSSATTRHCALPRSELSARLTPKRDGYTCLHKSVIFRFLIYQFNEPCQ